MRKVNLLAVCATAFASMLVFASCSQPEPAAEPSLDDEAAVTRATSLDNFARVAYVEVNDVNPLNAGEYTLSNGEPFFTHVILFASNIRGDASGNVHNYNNPNNEAILSIRPSIFSRYVTKASKSSWVTSATIPGPDSPT